MRSADLIVIKDRAKGDPGNVLNWQQHQNHCVTVRAKLMLKARGENEDTLVKQGQRALGIPRYASRTAGQLRLIASRYGLKGEHGYKNLMMAVALGVVDKNTVKQEWNEFKKTLSGSAGSSLKRKLTIFYAEDKDEVSGPIMDYLKSYKFRVIHRKDKESAVEELKRLRDEDVVVDIVVTDNSMGKKDAGLELIRWMRYNPAYKNIPIILFSKTACDKDKIEASRRLNFQSIKKGIDHVRRANLLRAIAMMVSSKKFNKSKESKAKILYVEDNRFIGFSITRFLVDEGYDVFYVRSVEEAVSELKRCKDVKIVITTNNMKFAPGSNSDKGSGIELIRQIRGCESYAGIPIILFRPVSF